MDNAKQVCDEEVSLATIAPKMLYFATPVALISSVNDNGSSNLAPISSFWALGWTFTLGLLTLTQTLKNFRKHPDCVINLPTRKCGSR